MFSKKIEKKIRKDMKESKHMERRKLFLYYW